MPSSNITFATLSESEFEAMKSGSYRAFKLLQEAGVSGEDAHAALQHDAADAGERLSAACPYERKRARLIVEDQYGGLKGPCYKLTFGNPKLRTPTPEFDLESTAPVSRHWRRGLNKLRGMGYEPRGFAVFELQECIPLEGERFVEPHFHAILWGVHEDDIRTAFRIHVPKWVHIRRRACQVKKVYDLAGAIDYVTKLRPTATIQYVRDDGGIGWRDRRAESPFETIWYRFMARHSIANMLSSVGDELRVLRMQRTCELAPPLELIGPTRLL